MKRILATMVLGFWISTPAFAQVVTTPAPMTDIKVLFCACGAPGATTNYLNPLGGYNEDSTMMPWYDWYHSTAQNTTTLKQMLIDGWTLHSVTPRGSSGSASVVDEFYFTFVRYAQPAPPPPADPPPAPERARPAAKR